MLLHHRRFLRLAPLVLGKKNAYIQQCVSFPNVASHGNTCIDYNSYILPPSIYLLHLSKIIFSKSLLHISLGPQVWLLICAVHLVLIGYFLSAFIAPWLLIGYDSLIAPCLKCKSALFTAPWSLCRRLIRWRLMDGGSIL